MDNLTDRYQTLVQTLLIRHQSILDIITKGQETSSRVNRAVVKAVTDCGCLGIDAHKKPIPEEANMSDLKDLLDSQIDGKLCENCQDIIEAELGEQFFYIAALANTLDISLSEVLAKQEKKLSTLTIFNLT
ncbi:hypothetical protein Desdi_0404 [Desulfitobacterium dichloroeliminans LMG P-21439]|uniref:DUF1573 domain-containing protein n=1 Tax=Desulfitobacterium dichloroeliminans (strain LMG P-21439 / DCA1) TaxID=871963 RepID=L0F4H6_DESDL|nr:hypothetical protein [Desulfitobacterium dichloroeliminans]AGA67950.1 hypothetical protein Desdi_0404 [Desulfitobacterium dichloroeliminans LMG P-21439]